MKISVKENEALMFSHVKIYLLFIGIYLHFFKFIQNPSDVQFLEATIFQNYKDDAVASDACVCAYVTPLVRSCVIVRAFSSPSPFSVCVSVFNVAVYATPAEKFVSVRVADFA